MKRLPIIFFFLVHFSVLFAKTLLASVVKSDSLNHSGHGGLHGGHRGFSFSYDARRSWTLPLTVSRRSSRPPPPTVPETWRRLNVPWMVRGKSVEIWPLSVLASRSALRLAGNVRSMRSEEHTSELQSRF